jgi:phosphoglycerol transferase MdoB-like AlkP superfamily enzyme
VSGFLPTPARSTVKLGLSQRGFFTLADLLGREGYRTQFIYGGESHFDNMKRFFTGNGFKEIIDQDDFEDPVFSGSWGVSDEDILGKAHESFLAMGDEPFFSLVFSVSNHSPWEYPEGRIELFDEDPATVNNTVRYADHALQRFFESARQAPYWDNTVFVVVADHDSRVHGASLVPIQHFHIPAVIIGPGIEPRRDARRVSQIDLGPTLLSLMGISSEHPMIGFDLTRLDPDHPGRAIMQYGSNHAFLEGDRAVIHQPNLPPTQYVWDGTNLTPCELDPALQRRALAHALVPSILYRDRSYRLPPLGAAARAAAAPAPQ